VSTVADVADVVDVALIGGVCHPLDTVAEFLARFIIFPAPHALHAMTLWIAHTWRMDAWDTTPRLVLSSADKGSGKTRVQEAAEFLVHQCARVTQATAAYIAGKLSQDPKPTIFYDEIDTVYGSKGKGNEDLRAILNGGYRKNNFVGRGGWNDNRLTTEEFDPYGALLLAGLGNLPDTVLDRAIVIRLRKRKPTDRDVESWRIRSHEKQARALGEQVGDWMKSLSFSDDEPKNMPVDDRAADIWEPLIKIADAAGGTWPTRAREAALMFTTHNAEQAVTKHVQLLWDIRRVFDMIATPKVATADLIDGLCRLDESRWNEYNFGRPITDRQMASLLGEFEVKSKDIRTSDGIRRGYDAADLMDAWERHPTPAHPLKVCDMYDMYDMCDIRDGSVA